jgi:hypothetical protein
MLRASLVALALATLLLWLVGLVDGATVWLTWLDGVAALLTLLLVPVTRDYLGPLRVSVGPALIGIGLVAMFVAGLATRASAWLVWFNLAFGAGYLMFAGFAFIVRAFEPQMESRRPLWQL